MNASMPQSIWNGYMAGRYASDVERYMDSARAARDTRDVCCHWVKCARRANRRMLDYLRRARGAA